jgi:DNA-binding PadR family transcriptional regulator
MSLRQITELGLVQILILHELSKVSLTNNQIHDLLQKKLTRKIPLAQIFVTTSRLKTGGYICGSGESSNIRRGRPAQKYTTTDIGAEAVKQITQMLAAP